MTENWIQILAILAPFISTIIAAIIGSKKSDKNKGEKVKINNSKVVNSPINSNVNNSTNTTNNTIYNIPPPPNQSNDKNVFVIYLWVAIFLLWLGSNHKEEIIFIFFILGVIISVLNFLLIYLYTRYYFKLDVNKVSNIIFLLINFIIGVVCLFDNDISINVIFLGVKALPTLFAAIFAIALQVLGILSFFRKKGKLYDRCCGKRKLSNKAACESLKFSICALVFLLIGILIPIIMQMSTDMPDTFDFLK